MCNWWKPQEEKAFIVMQTPGYPLDPFVIDVADDVLVDLKARLRATRWSTDLDNDDCYYGISTHYLRGLVDYWLNEFDWRAAERKINIFPQHRVLIDDVPVHFIRQQGNGPKPIPIIISHGWPWTFWDMSKIILPLADPTRWGGDPEDAFDVIVPSLPGFGFSTPVGKGDMNFWKIAELFHTLMTKILGHSKYAAAGADYGALVTGQLGHKYADALYGIHLGHDIPLNLFQGERPWDLTGGQMIPEDAPDPLRAEILRFHRTYASHVAVHMLDSQTLTHGLNDSPVGMLAWILQRWAKWSDKNADFEANYPRDHILTNATIFWVTQSIGSSIRSYANANRYPWRPSHDRQPAIEAPAGFTFLCGDVYPPASRWKHGFRHLSMGRQSTGTTRSI